MHCLLKRVLASFAVTVAVTSLANLPAKAGEGAASNYFPGAYGNLLVGVAPDPGFVVQSLNLFYRGEAERAVLQGAANLGIEAEVYASLLQGLHVWDAPSLNGRFAIGGYISGAHSTLDARLSAGPLVAGFTSDEFGLGDSGIIPASFYWNSGNFHLNLYELIIVPTGEYNSSQLVNIGRNYWSFDTVAAATWFDPQIGLDLSVVGGIMVNTTNRDTDYRTGTELHLDFMANQFLSETFAIGIHGYAYKQITGDSGSGAILGDFQGEGFGIGAAFNWIPAFGGGNVVISGKWMTDIRSVNRLEADYGVLSIAKAF